MQQAAMVGVAHIVVIEFPIAENPLALIPKDVDRFLKQAVNLINHLRAKIVEKGLGFVGECPKYDAFI